MYVYLEKENILIAFSACFPSYISPQLDNW